jgi:hypothetical protein
MSAEISTLDSLPSFPSCTEFCVRLNTDILELIVTVTCDPDIDFLKQNWVMSAEWSTFDSLRPFLFFSEICVRGNTDIFGINSYGCMRSGT